MEVIPKEPNGNYRIGKKKKKPHWMGSMADGDARTKSANLRTEQEYLPNLNETLT